MVLGCGYNAVLLVFSLGLLVALSLVVGLSLAVLLVAGDQGFTAGARVPSNVLFRSAGIGDSQC